jgi:hypothetical protein
MNCSWKTDSGSVPPPEAHSVDNHARLSSVKPFAAKNKALAKHVARNVSEGTDVAQIQYVSCI